MHILPKIISATGKVCMRVHELKSTIKYFFQLNFHCLYLVSNKIVFPESTYSIYNKYPICYWYGFKMSYPRIVLRDKRPICATKYIIITSRNNASISNFRGGFRWKSEYSWCIIEIFENFTSYLNWHFLYMISFSKYFDVYKIFLTLSKYLKIVYKVPHISKFINLFVFISNVKYSRLTNHLRSESFFSLIREKYQTLKYVDVLLLDRKNHYVLLRRGRVIKKPPK
ncbi:hypothetical protein AGLY_009885 [Aphis glycines]|uniref:Uncharacterized protein n=1 Tax=Aphis glycines TaxID=307491 RepID=A0A6G0TH45_APHGL|nr:hypothetical protein AGLY_009885 [Aphis glycines]